MVKVGIFGATGYAGFELVDLLQKHDQVEVVFCTSESSAGKTLDEIYAQGPHWPLIKSADAPLDEVDAVFLCLPHAASAATAVRARAAGCRVIDLSADFRLKSVETYEEWYKVEHPRPEWLQEAVYGLTEHARDAVKEADIVACPGCYPTSVLIPLNPIVKAGGVKAGSHIIADSKTGVSGGGRKANLLYHHVEVQDNMTPYAVGQSHRHWAEMSEKIAEWSNGDGAPELIFSPHLMAIPRGILSTIYVPLKDGWDEANVRALYEDVYGDELFVKVLPEGKTATVAHAVRSNRVAIGMTVAAGMLILTCAIDNLTKGSSGQAVQNFNLMYGFEESTALL